MVPTLKSFSPSLLNSFGWISGKQQRRPTTMSATEGRRSHLRRGQYLGDITALCFLHLPPRLSSFPLLLAGTSSHILVYDLRSGNMLRSFQVFEGIHVHGISLETFHKQLSGHSLAFRVFDYGERRVKLFSLQIDSDSQRGPDLGVGMTLMQSLPKFGHWVMDACFLKDGKSLSEDGCYLAIGCSDNSVCFWDILGSSVFSEVKSSEKCLLYTMKMLGNEIESLCIASGTIFNEIVVWEVVQSHTSIPEEDHLQLSSDENCPHLGSKYSDALISRLVGHEGSTFSIAWFSNGLKLVSVSDDRSARIWEVEVQKGGSCKDVQERVNRLAGPVLFGHLKNRLVLTFGYCLLRDPCSWRNFLGIIMALVGMILYSYYCTLVKQTEAEEVSTQTQPEEAGSDSFLLTENGAVKSN